MYAGVVSLEKVTSGKVQSPFENNIIQRNKSVCHSAIEKRPLQAPGSRARPPATASAYAISSSPTAARAATTFTTAALTHSLTHTAAAAFSANKYFCLMYDFFSSSPLSICTRRRWRRWRRRGLWEKIRYFRRMVVP